MSTNIDDESIEVFCKMVMDDIRVNPDTRPALPSLIETFMDNNVPQESWERSYSVSGNDCRISRAKGTSVADTFTMIP